MTTIDNVDIHYITPIKKIYKREHKIFIKLIKLLFSI